VTSKGSRKRTVGSLGSTVELLTHLLRDRRPVLDLPRAIVSLTIYRYDPRHFDREGAESPDPRLEVIVDEVAETERLATCTMEDGSQPLCNVSFNVRAGKTIKGSSVDWDNGIISLRHRGRRLDANTIKTWNIRVDKLISGPLAIETRIKIIDYPELKLGQTIRCTMRGHATLRSYVETHPAICYYIHREHNIVLGDGGLGR
jgi:hypothetical protein